MKNIVVKPNKVYDFLLFADATACLSMGLINGNSSSFTKYIIFFTAIFIVLLFLRTKGDIDLKPDLFLGMQLAFVAFFFLTSSLSDYSTHASNIVVRVLSNAICGTVLYVYYRKESTVDGILKVMMWNGYVCVIYIIANTGISVIIDQMLSAERLSSALINANTVGMNAALAVILNFYFIFKEKRLRWWNLLMIPSFLLTFASQSKKAFIIIVVGSVLVYFFVKPREADETLNKKAGKAVMILLLAGALLGLMETQLFSGMNERLQGFYDTLSDDEGVEGSTSDELREFFIEVGIEQFKKNPVIGVGLDCARYYTGRGYYLHNNYVELLADGGVIGFALYYMMYAYIIYVLLKCRKVKSPQKTMVIIIFAIRIITEFAAVTYVTYINQFYLILFFSEARVLRREYSELIAETDSNKKISDRTKA